MNQITLLFDFGQEIFIVLNENKMFKTKVKNYTVYDDSIFVGTPNGEFNVKDCFATFDDYLSKGGECEMICPYAVNRKVVTQTRMTYDENGQQTSWMEAQQNTAEFVECQKENCGAFHDGKCCYRCSCNN